MKRLTVLYVSLALATCCFGFHQNPNAHPGQDPNVRESFTAEELQKQQSGPKVFGPAKGSVDRAESHEFETPTDEGEASDLDATTINKEPTKIDGKQVLTQAQDDVEQQRKPGMLRAMLGLLVCGCVGFGGIAYARSWADKNSPSQEKIREGQKIKKRITRIS